MRKSNCVFIILSCFAVFGCQNAALTVDEASLLDSIGFDKQLLAEVKSIVRTTFVRYQTSDPGFSVEDGVMEKTGLVAQKGALFRVPSRDQYLILPKVRKSLQKTGYLAFLTDLGWGEDESESSLVVIKSDDQFDILRYEKPDGINYGITDADLLNQLKEWDSKYGIDIIGADYDYVDFALRSLPPDLRAFAEEIYEFCPDSVDQGVGDIESLEKELQKKRLFLWWD